MSKGRELRLHEAILLLALHDQKGTTALGSMHDYALGGAALAELLLEGRLEVVADRRGRQMVEVADPSPTRDPLLDAALERIRAAKRRATLETWVTRLGSRRDMVHVIARSLCRRGILRADEDRVLLLFKRKTYPEVDPRPERELIERLRRAIFAEVGEPADPDVATIVALAHGANLLTNAFDRNELRGRKKRIAELMAESSVGRATRAAIEAVTAAIVAATVVASAT